MAKEHEAVAIVGKGKMYPGTYIWLHGVYEGGLYICTIRSEIEIAHAF